MPEEGVFLGEGEVEILEAALRMLRFLCGVSVARGG